MNPLHLFAGTPLANSIDAQKKGRLKTSDQKGSNNGNAKLKPNDIAQIRMMMALGLNNIEIGMYMNVSHAMISCIRRGKSWAHLP